MPLRDASGSRSLPGPGYRRERPRALRGSEARYSVSGGSDGGLLKALKAPRDKDGASYEIIAPKVTGLEASDGSWVEAEQMIDGGPSVLYDAVALLPARMRWTTCSKNPRHAISSPIPSRTASDRVRRSCTSII